MESAAREKDPKFLEFLRAHFRLDEDRRTVWRLSRLTETWKVARGKLDQDGYRQLELKGVAEKPIYIRLHRLVWFLAYGAFPANTIDHIDRNRANNHVDNLRDVTMQENNLNRGVSTKAEGKSSKYLGVSFHRLRGKFIAQIKFEGRLRYLGYFKTAEDAAKIRDDFVVQHGLTEQHSLNFPRET